MRNIEVQDAGETSYFFTVATARAILELICISGWFYYDTKYMVLSLRGSLYISYSTEPVYLYTVFFFNFERLSLLSRGSLFDDWGSFFLFCNYFSNKEQNASSGCICNISILITECMALDAVILVFLWGENVITNSLILLNIMKTMEIFPSPNYT